MRIKLKYFYTFFLNAGLIKCLYIEQDKHKAVHLKQDYYTWSVHQPQGFAELASHAPVLTVPVSDASPALARHVTLPSASSFHLLLN